MDKLPFSVYDFFGYLASGFAILVAVAAAFTKTTSWQVTPSLTVSLILITCAYASGQVVANMAGFSLERMVVGGWLRRPTQHLLGLTPKPRFRSKLFPGYYTELPEPQQEACFTRSGLTREQCEKDGEAMFYKAFAEVKKDAEAMGRLSTFLNLYGFCRNMTLSMLVAGSCLAAGSLSGRADTGRLVHPGWWAAGAFALAVGLFYRYLKFFRTYSLELFVTYGADHHS